jgi:hypothetical protein
MLTNPWLVAVLLNTVLLGIAAIAPKKLLTADGLSPCLGSRGNCLGKLGMVRLSNCFILFPRRFYCHPHRFSAEEAEGIAEKERGCAVQKMSGVPL